MSEMDKTDKWEALKELAEHEPQLFEIDRFVSRYGNTHYIKDLAAWAIARIEELESRKPVDLHYHIKNDGSALSITLPIPTMHSLWFHRKGYMSEFGGW